MAFKKKDGNFMGLPMNIARGNPIPLDKSEIWYSYEELINYARNSSVAYVGQILGLVNEELNTATAYIILNTDGDVQEIGSNVQVQQLQGDEKSIELQNDFLGFNNWGIQYYKYIAATDTEEAHYQLQVVDSDNPWISGLEPKVTEENGELVLAWYEPNLSSIEDVSDKIITLQSSVKDLKDNTYTKKQIDEKIASAAHLKRTIVNSIEQIDINADDADQFIYMVLSSPEDEANKYNEYMVIIITDEDGEETRFIEQVGSWKVDLSNYVTNIKFSEELNKKVDIKPAHSLVLDTEISKLSRIEDGAQKNFISGVNNDNFEVINGMLNFKTISIQKVDKLEDVLNNKVTKEEGKGLSTNDFTNEHLQNLNNTISNYQIINSKVVSIEEILNGKQSGEETVPGLISIVKSNSSSIQTLDTSINEMKEDIQYLYDNLTPNPGPVIDTSQYITKTLFHSVVGTEEELQENSQTLNSQIQDLKEAITWSELK